MRPRTLQELVRAYLAAEDRLNAAASEAGRKACKRHFTVAREELARALDQPPDARRASRVFRRILVAVDDSKQSPWAEELAVTIASEAGAVLGLVHVVPFAHGGVPPHPIALESFRNWHRAAGDRMLQERARRLPPSLTAEQFLRDGPAAAEIVNVAVEWGADLIVIGSHGRGRIGQFVLGSTAQEVIQRSPCPVLTITNPRARLREVPGDVPSSAAASVLREETE